jgi:hypothetical protein
MDRIYVIEHAPDGDIARSYTGMSAEVVAELVAEGGNSYDIVTEEQYKAALPKPRGL